MTATMERPTASDALPLTLDHPRVNKVLAEWQGSYAFRVIGFDGHEFKFAVVKTATGEEPYELHATLREDGKWYPQPCNCPDRMTRKRACKHEILFRLWGNTIPGPASRDYYASAQELEVVGAELPHPALDAYLVPPTETVPVWNDGDEDLWK